MATFDLHISCGNVDEFSEIAGRLFGAALAPHEGNANTPGMGAQVLGGTDTNATEISVPDEKPKRGRKAKADTTVPQPTQNPDGTPIEPVKEPVPQPTPGGTEAPPAESIPPNQQADVFGGGEVSTGAPAATAGGDASGAPDLPALKNAMANLLKVKSSMVAMETLEKATGCRSLSSGSPSVIEKAKDDPGIMQRTLDALVAAAAAA